MNDKKAAILSGLIVIVAISSVFVIAHPKIKPFSSEVIRLPTYHTAYTLPRYTKTDLYESDIKWNSYPIYELTPNSIIPKSFDTKKVDSEVCQELLRITNYSYGSHYSINAFGLSWTEYKGKWIALSRYRHEHVGYGKRSIPPGNYPYCAAGSNTNSVTFKVYVGDYNSLVSQHLSEKSTFEKSRVKRITDLQERVEKVGL